MHEVNLHSSGPAAASDSRAVTRPHPERDVDWAAMWFHMMEKLGENTLMSFWRIGPDGQVREKRSIPHTEQDGIGAMRMLLHDPSERDKPLPAIRHPKRPHWLKVLFQIIRHARTVGKQTIHWKSYDPTRTGRAPAVAWASIEPAAHEALKRYSATRKTSLNTVLLLCLERAARKRFLSHGTSRWSMPVNLRGATGRAEHVPNQFSLIDIICPEAMEPEELHFRIIRQLKRGNHWANWALMHLGKHIGYERAEKLFVGGYNDPKPCTGGFSSVGEWQSAKVAPDEAWLAFGPSSKLSPISGSSAAVNGRLSVTVQVHPTLSPTPERIQDLMEGWMSELRALTGVPGIPERARVERLDP